MRTRCLGACVAAAFLVEIRATTTIRVDDSDPGIEYRGNWVHNPIDDPKNLNYEGSVTYTNATGSTASYRFRGTGIAVFGAFEVAGTFDMHSTYSIDGGPPTDFLPAGTVLTPAYHQKFFQSGTLSDGEHTLVITNNAREFWFDYVEVTQLSSATTTSVSTTQPQQAQTPPRSTAQAAPSTTEPAGTSPTGHPGTTQAVSSLSSQTQSTQSFANTDNDTLTSPTSANAAATSPSHASSASQSQTSDLVSVSGVTSPTSTATRARSSKIPVGGIVGLAVGGFLAFTSVAVVGYMSCRRMPARSDLTPYDPGLTTLAVEPREKQDLEYDGSSRGSTATSLRSLPPPAPAYVHSPLEVRASETSGEHSVPPEIITTDLEEARMGGDRRTGFQPLGSPASASPLLPRRPRRIGPQLKDSPTTPSTGASCYMSPFEERRRSMDGGVRLAGGPPEEVQQEDDRGDDVRSGLSTLPPAYGLYPAA